MFNVKFFSTALIVLVAVGCVNIHHHQVPPAQVPSGWITIGGTGIPGATVPTTDAGKSLVEVLSESKTFDLLRHENVALATFAPQEVQQPGRVELEAIRSIYSNSFSGDVDVPKELDKLLAQLNGLKKAHPTLSVPSSWPQGWPMAMFDLQGSEAAIKRIKELVSGMENSSDKLAAESAIAKFSPGQPKMEEAIGTLSRLAANGRLAILQEEKEKAWLYSGVRAASDRNKLLTNLAATLNKSSNSKVKELAKDFIKVKNGEDLASSTSEKSQNAKKLIETEMPTALPTLLDMFKANERMIEFGAEILELKSPQASIGTSIPTMATNGTVSLQDLRFVFVKKASKENFVVPLDAVSETAIGSLWLLPGDQVQVMRFGELPSSQSSAGVRSVGFIGLTSSPGILQTHAATAGTAIGQVSGDASEIANMVVISSSWNGVNVQALLPYGATNSELMQAKVQSILSSWSVDDGAVIKFDNMALSPIIVKSRRLQQVAAARRVGVFQEACIDGKTDEERFQPAGLSSNKSGLPGIVQEGCETAKGVGARLRSFSRETREMIALPGF